MGQWRLRDPGSFPPSFHEAMRQGVGLYVAQRFHTDRAVKTAQEQWRLFQFCLRHYPGHPTGALLPLFQRRSSCGYNNLYQRWELRIDVKETASSLFDRAKVLKNSLDPLGSID